MNPYDIFVVTILAGALAVGLWKGLIKQVLSLAGLALGYAAAVSYYEPLAACLPGGDMDFARIVAFLLIMAGCMLAAMLLSFLLSKFMGVVGLAFLNHAGGGIVGAVKGWLLVAVVSLVLIAFLPVGSPVLTGSSTLPYVVRSLEVAKNAMPYDLKTKYFLKLKALQSYRFGGKVEDVGKEMFGNPKGTNL